jgi:hypothetical protein
MSAVTASFDRAGTAARPGVPAVPADDVLVVGLRLHDENAYLERVRRHTPLMLRVARSILGSAEAAGPLDHAHQRVLLHRGRARLRVLLGPGAVDAVAA